MSLWKQPDPLENVEKVIYTGSYGTVQEWAPKYGKVFINFDGWYCWSCADGSKYTYDPKYITFVYDFTNVEL